MNSFDDTCDDSFESKVKQSPLTPQDIYSLVINPSEWQAPNTWDKKFTYQLLKDIIKVVNDEELSNKILPEILSRLLDQNVETVKQRIHHVANFIKKISNKIKKLSASELVQEINEPELSYNMDAQPETNKNELGPFCTKLGLFDDNLLNFSDTNIEVGSIILTLGAICELGKLRQEKNISFQVLNNIVFNLASNVTARCSDQALRTSIEKILSKKNKLTHSKDKSKLAEFYDLPYIYPKRKDYNENITSMRSLENTLSSFSKANSILNEQIIFLKSQLNDEVLKNKRKEEIETQHQNLIKSLQYENTKLSNDLAEKMKIVSKFQTRNVNKRIKTQVKNNKKLKELVKEKEKELEEIQEINETISKKLEQALRRSNKERKRLSRFLHKAELVDDDDKPTSSYIQNLKAQVQTLENEKLELEEKVQLFLHEKEVMFFKDGKYTNEIRMVYEDLLTLGVGTRNVEKIVHLVLEKLAGFNVGRLPKVTFANYMLMEARNLSQIQVAMELLNESTFNTLHSDGTSKHGRGFTTFDATKDDGTLLVLGMREVGSGDAQAQLDLLKEVIKDIEDAKIDGEEEFSFYNKAFSSFKNLMSDRCSTQKRFNDLFIEYRKSILPEIEKNWQNLSVKEKEKIENVNEFFCGLHFLVALADQAEASCKVWENLIFDNVNKIGSLSHGGYSTGGESGVLRLVRTVCKSVQEKGCEKSGRMVTFATFMKEEYDISRLPLYPFLGNRFNILFLNAAGVFSLYPQLKIFFESIKDDNRLLNAVYHDLNVLAFQAGVKALGLIDKVVTGPLWRVMTHEKFSLKMNKHYQKCLTCFEKWSDDPSAFMVGEDLLFPEETKDDEKFKCLFEKNDEIDGMVRQVLEIIFKSFIYILKKMLSEHLVDGEYEKNEARLSVESKCVPATNCDPERDFGMLDRLMRLKPRALDIVIEGLIMFSRNKTSVWRDSLSEKELKVVMEKARKMKGDQKKIFFQRKKAIHEIRAAKLRSKNEEKERKNKLLALEKERLLQGLDHYGGLWNDENIESKCRSYKDEKELRMAIKFQLKFRQKVVGSSCDKSLFFVTSGGKARSAKTLKENLLKVMKWSELNDLSVEGSSGSEEGNVIKLLPKSILEKAKGKISEKTRNQQEKKDSVPSNKKKISRAAKRRKTGVKSDNKRLPLCSIPDDLVGKYVSHWCDVDEEEDECVWQRGVILDIWKNCNFGNKTKFLIRYNCLPDEVHVCSFEDFLNGNLKLVEVVPNDFIGASIRHLYTDEKTGEDHWWDAEVVDVDLEDDDKDNPSFWILYDNFGVEDLETDDYYFETLMDDYLNGWVRLVHVDLDEEMEM